MMDDDYLAQLLTPEDDRAWKLAVGKALRETVGQTTRTNGRVTALEAWRNRMVGALAFIAVSGPIAATILVKLL